MVDKLKNEACGFDKSQEERSAVFHILPTVSLKELTGFKLRIKRF